MPPLPPPTPPRKYDPAAAILSYIVPGLGQVYQGRLAKGFLYFVCLYSLFFYGMFLGYWQNVWLPDAKNLPDVKILNRTLPGIAKDLNYRKEFLGQFWIGAAAWPALLQYAGTPPLPDPASPLERQAWKPAPNALVGTYMQTPNENRLNDLQRDGDKRWDLGWVYTVIAGVLNILVIYDALAGPLVREEDEAAAEAGIAK
jgi:hypothetical protein